VPGLRASERVMRRPRWTNAPRPTAVTSQPNLSLIHSTKTPCESRWCGMNGTPLLVADAESAPAVVARPETCRHRPPHHGSILNSERRDSPPRE